MAIPPQNASSQTAGNAPEYSVSELSGAIKKTLESGFEHVRVRGELGRISRPGSGHVYLDLKDDRSVIAGVIWKGVAGRLRVKPEQGMEVIATGRLTTFPGQSKYQIVIEALEPAGVGALMALLEERKKKLGAEGLFDEARKQPIPFLPRVIGIVTSPTGAVIRDMLHGFDERFPAQVYVWPVRVQGESCAAEVAAAIRGFNAIQPGGPVPRPDVLIVARGGGSLEDLWGFNEEVVVRAAAESELPLISAVGHETDWTLIDLAADARAPTPTKAAEWAVPKHSELLERITHSSERLTIALRRRLESAADRLRAAVRGLPRRDVLLAEPRQRLDRCEQRLASALRNCTNKSRVRLIEQSAKLSPRLLAARISRCREALTDRDNRSRAALTKIASRRRVRLEGALGRLRVSVVRNRLELASERLSAQGERLTKSYATGLRDRRQRLNGLSGLLRSLSYHGVLQRGFALVRDENGATVRRAETLTADKLIEIEFADGRVEARTLDDGPKPPKKEKSTSNKKQPGAETVKKQSSPPENCQETPPVSTDGEARRPSRKPRNPDQGTLF